jgi:alkanesulfonate monooxygenase SsuD/methylene tetrahydromethanopterin reductase-like flavin-dependent oxidoreductase (luciferase family)
MHRGVAMFLTQHAMRPGELARAVEERGFESLWFTEHSHIPLRAPAADFACPPRRP